MAPNAKVLIIDDNEKDLKLLKDYLTSHGYAVDTVNNGPDGLKQMKVNPPDLVITDINMPDLSGWKTCDQIKSDPLLRHIPILMCSASIEDDGNFGAYQAGDAYMQKPLNLLSLLAMVQKLIENKSEGQ
jgi:CheY-like chemotaxis protein